jgi:hypothetical protein
MIPSHYQGWWPGDLFTLHFWGKTHNSTQPLQGDKFSGT